MEFINNTSRGYKDLVKWASTPDGQKTIKLIAIFALSVTLAYGIGYLIAYNSNPTPIIFQTSN